jgi:hypothetical protein
MSELSGVSAKTATGGKRAALGYIGHWAHFLSGNYRSIARFSSDPNAKKSGSGALIMSPP